MVTLRLLRTCCSYGTHRLGIMIDRCVSSHMPPVRCRMASEILALGKLASLFWSRRAPGGRMCPPRGPYSAHEGFQLIDPRFEVGGRHTSSSPSGMQDLSACVDGAATPHPGLAGHLPGASSSPTGIPEI